MLARSSPPIVGTYTDRAPPLNGLALRSRVSRFLETPHHRLAAELPLAPDPEARLFRGLAARAIRRPSRRHKSRNKHVPSGGIPLPDMSLLLGAPPTVQ